MHDETVRCLYIHVLRPWHSKVVNTQSNIPTTCECVKPPMDRISIFLIASSESGCLHCHHVACPLVYRVSTNERNAFERE